MIVENSNIHVVLVNSIYSRNVGATSRSMGNMGAGRLILINPKCEINLEARQGAAGAQRHLVELTQYAAWADFFEKEPDGIRFAFCARNNNEQDEMYFTQRLEILKKEHNLNTQLIYLIFGPEDHGLTNEDKHFANFIVQLPTYGEFNCLNLSHAVLLALFLLHQSRSSQTSDKNSPAPQTETFYFPEETIVKWLNFLGFEVGGRRTDAYKVLKRILLKNISTAKELKILESVIIQTVRRLTEKS
ncbi:MAG: TrmH family RNA methyltransferase [Bdellovibrionales bacterium]